MDNRELIESFSEFKSDKNIDRVTLMAILEEVFRVALKRKYGSDDNFDIIVNPDKGDLEIWRNRVVVGDDMVEDDNEEISLTDARKIEPDFEIGEDVSEEVKIIDLGRRAILSLGQNLRARILEHDHTILYKEIKERIGEIITGEIHHVRPHVVMILDDDDVEMILPKDQQIPSDYYRKGETIRAVLKDVELRGTKPQIILSRTSPVFLEKLFEQEIPEVADGLITIKKVVRVPGEKAKVAVESYDERIDPVGACVGMKGNRIHSIVRELSNENIDVINYTSNVELLISRAMNPARVLKIEIKESEGKAEVWVSPDEVSKAIGRGGNNIRLAGQLVGYEIDVFRDIPHDDDVDLEEFSDEIEAWVIEAFYKIGVDTAKSVLNLSVEELVQRTDLEEETVKSVKEILSAEFDE